jgi:hypothetical protein
MPFKTLNITIICSLTNYAASYKHKSVQWLDDSEQIWREQGDLT